MAEYEVKNGVGIIPEGTKILESYAFKNCEELKSIVIPGTVEVIEHRAFSGCKGLTNVVIPDPVTTIEAWAFEKCISPVLKQWAEAYKKTMAMRIDLN